MHVQGKPEFGYTRKDIILIGGGLIGFGFAMYYGLQAGGVDPLVAGNFVQLFVILGICLGYISTYFIRVANKARAGALHSVTKMLFPRYLSDLVRVGLFHAGSRPEDPQVAGLNEDLQACPRMLPCCS